jgi:hypothetical protein
LSDFERVPIAGARLAGASVTRTATLLGVSRATVCKVMSAREDTISEEKQWSKVDIDRKRSSYSEKECLKIHRCHYATSRKVASSIPDEAIGFFN